ncbi:protein DA1 [Ktedonosporobacter rubrisoli]|nr:protein DA1 [Ktedonosporobacter rubrisoli]
MAMPARPICKKCGQPIYGRYLTTLGAQWHPEHFICAGCGLPIREQGFQVHAQQPYHETCYINQVLPRCAVCGQPIQGRAISIQGDTRSYHPACYAEHAASRCAYCHKPLLNGYRVDYWGTKYCDEHEKQYPHCVYCSRLVPPQQQRPGEQEVRCTLCRSEAIETVDEARPIYMRVRQWVGAQGLRYNNLPLSLELCGPEKLATYFPNQARKHLGATLSASSTFGEQILSTEVTGVAVLQGLPSSLFAGVAIHELGHVWLIVHGIEHLPTWAVEGFCELLAYRYYRELNSLENRYQAEQIERNPDPIYGEGFRRVRARAEALGFPRFLEQLRTTKRLT